MKWHVASIQNEGVHDLPWNNESWVRFGPVFYEVRKAVAFLCRLRNTLPGRSFIMVEIEDDYSAPTIVPMEEEIFLIAERKL